MIEHNELDSTCGVSDDELTERFKEAIRIDNEIKRIKGTPIAGYDPKNKRAFLQYPDGRIEYVAEGKLSSEQIRQEVIQKYAR